jgi:1-acyl-sn-glycerol-3-phosphate acyltransferase
MAWDNAFNWFLIGRFIRYLGAFPVGLGRRGYVQASRKALQVLKNGATLIIFPEGEREFSDGNMLPFKPGAVRLALDAKVPILPVSIRGGNKIWAQDARFPRFNKVEIIYHPLLNVEPSENPVQLQQYAKRINSKLFEIISNS